MRMVGKEPPASEITPEALYLRRREFMRNAALFTATSAGVGGSLLWLMRGGRAEKKTVTTAAATPDLAVARHDDFAPGESPTPYRDVTTYNNFYEFGPDKADPAENAGSLRTRPWTVTVDGEVRQAAGHRHRRAPRAGSRSRSASTACAASRRGRW